jgi:Ca-activated chloride channel family protein
MFAVNLLGFDLLRPAQAAWLASALVLALAAIWGLRMRRREREQLVAPRHALRFLPGFSPARAIVRVILASAAAALIAFALTGPVRGYTEKSVQRKGLDLVVCIDTSRSMLVRDLRPDRLTRAKREVAGLIDQLHGDRVALVAFAGDARDVAPLTHDRTTLRALLDRVTPDDNTVGGTDLGVALGHALEMFDGRSGAHEAIVMLTDGEDLGGTGLEVAKKAAEKGIRIYVVGMATEAGGKIPLTDKSGAEHFVADESGAEVLSALGGTSLAQIAAATGGDFLPATRSATPLEEIYKQRITKLEGRELDSGVEYVPHDRFQWFLVLAICCMLAEGVMRERKPVAGGAV